MSLTFHIFDLIVDPDNPDYVSTDVAIVLSPSMIPIFSQQRFDNSIDNLSMFLLLFYFSTSNACILCLSNNSKRLPNLLKRAKTSIIPIDLRVYPLSCPH
jgi:hypothetical protein